MFSKKIPITVVELVFLNILSWGVVVEQVFDGQTGSGFSIVIAFGFFLTNVLYVFLRLLYALMKKQILQNDKIGRVFLPAIIVICMLLTVLLVIGLYGMLWFIYPLALVFFTTFLARTSIISQFTSRRKT